MPAKKKKPVGRPPVYTEKVANEICRQVALGKSVRSICTQKGFPTQWTVIKWLSDEDNYIEFITNYARAREQQADSTYEEIMGVELDVQAGVIDAQAARVLIDSKKWRAGRMKPKTYGDKVNIEHSGSISSMTDEQLDAKIAMIMAKIDEPINSAEG